MSNNFRINIPRPIPGTGENEKIIAFIEPLRNELKVKVSGAYHYNLTQYERGDEPALAPGFRYEFTFIDQMDATAFKLNFGGEEVV